MSQSVMGHSFAQAPVNPVQRTMFLRKSRTITTFDEGKIIPLFRAEVNPGETINMNDAFLCRTQPLVKPLMDNLYLHIAWFFVPFRLVWDCADGSWVRFWGERDNPDDDPEDLVTPQVVMPAVTGCVAESLFDYLGVPPGVASLSVNAFYSRGYNLIYNEYFRDQNLIDSAVVDKDNGPDTVTDYVIRRCAKMHDYFTSALPYAQKHDDVLLPLGSNAPIVGFGKKTATFTYTNKTVYETDNTVAQTYANCQLVDGYTSENGNNSFYVEKDATRNLPAVFADLSNAVGATINEIRQMVAFQQLYEMEARAGSRYSELCLSMFGVANDDRAHKPEVLGLQRVPITINPIAQTSATSAGAPQGNLAGIGKAFVKAGFTKSFVEHGFVICLGYVKADQTYCQGLHRDWTRRTREEFLIPGLAGIGEQAIRLDEIFCQGTSEDDDVFGYAERYAEMKFGENLITGKNRPTYQTPLDAWHLCNEFSGKPTLNQTFIEENAPMARVLEVTDEPHFQIDCYFENKHVRPLPLFCNPGLSRF